MLDASDQLLPALSPSLKHSVLLSSEKSSSNWFTTLPLSDHGYALHKGAFHDALCFRYGWQPSSLPSSCVCEKPMSVEHTFSCSFGGFQTIRHNELHDITAGLLSEVCHNVHTEPPLQPLSGEQFHYRTANVKDGARLDVGAESFWGRDRRMVFFDIKLFHPLASSYVSSPLAQCFQHAELQAHV